LWRAFLGIVQAGHAAVERVDVPGDLVADDGELGQRGVEHLPLEVRAAVQPVAEERVHQQQQRKQRDDAVVGDLGGQVAALVVEELVDHRQRQAGPPVLPLVGVSPADQTHCSSSRWLGLASVASSVMVSNDIGVP
jgi:hypothetical protein